MLIPLQVSVCLTAKTYGTKTKPFIVFQGAKREAATLNKDFKHCFVVASSANGWMNEEFTLLYLKKLLDPFASKRGFWFGILLKVI